ncbi:MAG TPA: TRAP transporter substrate-binding protein DctP [Stellaceae bacterium]|nr:TRAP transporter substrate-binding protein DctP [Stellaceae bacterium]
MAGRRSLLGLIVALLSMPLVRASADEMSMIFVTAEPAPSPDTVQVFKPWAQRVAAAAHGAVHIDVRDGTAIVNPINMYDRVQSDVFQIGLLIPSLVGGKFPLTDMVGLPFLTDDSVNASIAFWRLYKTGALDAEYRDIVPLAMALFPPQGVHLVKPPASLDDLRGLRLRVVSKTGSESIARLGGTPLVLDPGDQYASLQRGMLDGIVSSWMQMGPLHLTEVTHYHIDTSLGTGMFMVFMARQKHDALPPAIRQAIDDNSGEPLTRAMAATFEQRSVRSRAPVAAAPDKHTIVQLTPAQNAKWRAAVAPVLAAWTASHPGGAKLVARYRAILAAVKAGK